MQSLYVLSELVDAKDETDRSLKAMISQQFSLKIYRKKHTVVFSKTSRGIFENVQCFFKNVQCFFQNNGMFYIATMNKNGKD